MTSSVSGLDIKVDFCKFAIPRLQELMGCISENENAQLHQEITDPCRFSDIFIFHSLKTRNRNEISPTIQRLARQKCISFDKTCLGNWCVEFMHSVLREGTEHFQCRQDELEELKNTL